MLLLAASARDVSLRCITRRATIFGGSSIPNPSPMGTANRKRTALCPRIDQLDDSGGVELCHLQTADLDGGALARARPRHLCPFATSR